jgi:hypothetical protein
MSRIKHPRFQPGRVKSPIASIVFIDGYADVDLGDNDDLRLALIQHGYEIDESVGLEERTVAELRAELEDLGYDVKTAWRKPELIERIAQHHELATEKVAPADGVERFATVEMVDGTVVGDGTSMVTLHDDGTATVED